MSLYSKTGKNLFHPTMQWYSFQFI